MPTPRDDNKEIHELPILMFTGYDVRFTSLTKWCVNDVVHVRKVNIIWLKRLTGHPIFSTHDARVGLLSYYLLY